MAHLILIPPVAKHGISILSGFRDQMINGVNQDHTTTDDYMTEGSPFVDNFIPSNDHNEFMPAIDVLTITNYPIFANELIEEIRNRGVARTLGRFLNRSSLIAQIQMSS